jgi:formate dehydrogenase major subunit
MITLTIDGKTIQVAEGSTVLQAAREAGVEIPTLCDHPNLTPYGGCRLCLVEVEGARTLQTSCTLPVTEKMIVRTDTPRIKEARRFILTLIFSERNHFCPYCQVSGGDCELQNAAYDLGMTHWQLPPNWTPYPVDASHPYLILENNRCILCRRCVRVCGDLVGNYTLEIQERGPRSLLIADTGIPLGESTCISCGMCVQVCPTGAIIDRTSAYQGHDTQLEHHESICLGCSLGCKIDVLTRNGRITRIDGDWEGSVNGGLVCKKGRFEPIDEKRERLTRPIVKKGGSLVPATWDEALDTIAAKFTTLSGKKDGIAALASTRLPAESLFAFKQLFAGKLGSGMVTSIEEGQTTAMAASIADEKKAAFESQLGELATADCVLAIGVDLYESHEVAGFFVKRNLVHGTKLIVIDPAANGLDSVAHISLKGKKGSDADILRGLAAALVKISKAKNPQRMDADQALADASTKTGIAVENFLAAAEYLGSAAQPVIVYGKGITTQEGTITLKGLLDLANTAGAGIIGIKGEANSLAASQYHMDAPFTTKGYQAAFLALGDDVPSQRLISAVEGVPFLVVQAAYASKLTAMADVVLPVEMWAETDGHFVNLDGHIQLASHSLPLPEGIRTNVAALSDLAEKLGIKLEGDWKKALTDRSAVIAITA